MPHTILIADDDPSLRLLVTTTLADDSLVLLEARDGTQALELARQERPDLILLDVAMPGLTGLEVCRALKAAAATAQLPVVMLTAQGQENDRERGLQAGAAAYLTKPFSPLQLLRLVEDLLRDRARATAYNNGGSQMNTHPLEDGEVLSTTEAAACCGVSPETIRRWIRSKGLPAYNTDLGLNIRIRLRDLQEFARKHNVLLLRHVPPGDMK